MNKPEILNIIREKAAKYRLNPAIVYGVCMRESTMSPKATRYEPDYRWVYKVVENAERLEISDRLETLNQKTSWGIMQIMGGVLREYGYEKRIPEILHDIEAQFEYSCRHLYNKIKRYGPDLGILSYNSGSPKKAPHGGFLPVEEQPRYEDYLLKVREYAAHYEYVTSTKGGKALD